MKKIFYIVPMLLVLLTACQREETDSNNPNAVKISATISDGNPLSRTAPTATAANDKWQTGDVIAVSNNNGSANYTFSGTAWTVAGSDYLTWDAQTMPFTAHHPVGEGVSMSNFELPTDQSTPAKIAKADYMTFSGDKTRPNESNIINLELTRKTARIILSVTAGVEYNNLGPTVSDVKINSAYSGYAGSSVTGSVTPIYPCLSNNKRYALVIPTAAAADKVFITLTMNYTGGKKYLTLTGIPALAAGNSYTISLTAGKDKLTMDGITAGGWTDGGSEQIPSQPILTDIYEYFDPKNNTDPGKTYMNGTQLPGEALTIATTVANNKVYSVDIYLNVFIDGVKQYQIKDNTVSPDNILNKYASIVVSGDDIYVSAVVVSDGGYSTYVWKNENRVILPEDLQQGYVTGMTLTDGNIYIYVYTPNNMMGYIHNLTNNTTVHTLASGEEFRIIGMVKVGSNLYSAGVLVKNTTCFLRVWKNDKVIFSRDDATEVSAIALVDNTLYLGVNKYLKYQNTDNDVFGNIIIYKGDISVDNPQFNMITEIKRNDNNSFAIVNDIAIAPNGDVYIAGSLGQWEYSCPTVWKNGTVYHTYNAKDEIKGEISHIELVSK